MASRSNGFQLTAGRTQPRFSDQPLFGDDKDLKSNVGDLSREEMKERLFVAEKVMKTLFKRNKELEELHLDQVEDRPCPQCNGDGAAPAENEDALQAKVKELERQIEAMAQG